MEIHFHITLDSPLVLWIGILMPGPRVIVLDDSEELGGKKCPSNYLTDGSWFSLTFSLKFRHGACHHSNLNSINKNTNLTGSYADTIVWRDFRGYWHSLRSAKMAIKVLN